MTVELAGWNSATSNLSRVRPLTEDEIAKDEEARPIFAEARERLKLFQILELNYKAWEGAGGNRKVYHSGNHKVYHPEAVETVD